MTEIIRFRSSYIEPYPLQVVGESYHRENIESLFSFVDDEGVNQDDFIAQLILEDQNPNDPQAVRVEIDHKIVGHLSRPNAITYRDRFSELRKPTAIGSCYASIKGGFRKKDDEVTDFGVRLDLDLSEPLAEIALQPPRPIQSVPPPVAAPPIKKQITASDILRRILAIFHWAFARGRWWKTLLFLFIVLPILCGLLQNVPSGQ